jgi:transposase-like protein
MTIETILKKIEEQAGGETTVADLCRKHNVTPSLYYNWKKRSKTRNGPYRPRAATKKKAGKNAVDMDERDKICAQIAKKAGLKQNSAVELCREHNIHPSTYYNWKSRRHEKLMTPPKRKYHPKKTPLQTPPEIVIPDESTSQTTQPMIALIGNAEEITKTIGQMFS